MSNLEIGNITGTNISTGIVSYINPYDDYSINLTHPGSLSVYLTGLSDNADVLLLDSQKNVVASSLLTGTTSDIFTVNNLTAGNYFVQVKSAGGETPYQLKLSVDPLTGMGIESGYFTVGSTGQIGIDFLLDGGWYQGEVGIFRLDGMEAYAAGSAEFIKEAARRALSNSPEGYVIIKDETEGAKFNASFGWENNYNSGNYEGIKTFKMNPGEKFAVMLVPNGTVENLFKNPNFQGDLLPLFSLATSNPNDAFHIGQIADVTGDGRTLVMEDWRMDFGTDKDYNDVVFRFTGAKGYAIKLDDVIDPSKDWRTSDVGTQLRNYVNTAPQFLEFTTQASYQLGETINFSDAKVFDENGDLAKVEIWVKSAGEDWLKKGEITEFNTDIDGWASFNYGLSDLAAGNYEVKVIGIDSLGKTSNEVIQNIEILGPVVAPVNTAPQYLEFSILSVINVGETVNLSNGKVLDAEGVSDLGKVEFWLQKDGGEWQLLEQKVTQFLANGTGWGTFDYSLTSLDTGSYQIKGIAYDLAGNSSNEFIQGFEVKLPETAPTGLQFYTDKPIYNSGEAVNISGGKVYDVNGIGDLEKVVFSLQKDGGEWEVFKEVREFTSDLDGWGNFDLELKKHWEAGSYQIKAIAYDKIGNFSEEVVRNFVVSAPIEMPANNAPDLLQFGLSQVYKVGDVVSLMGGKVYDADGVNNLAKVDFLLKKDKEDWQDISDVIEFTPGAEGWANFSYQLADLGVGSYQLKAVAFDKSNAVSNSVVQSFEVVSGEVQVPVNSAPQFLQFGLNSFYTFGEQIGLTNGLIYDEEGKGDLEKIEFRLKKNQGNWQSLEEAVIEFGDNGNGWGSFSYVLPFLEEGNYRLEGIGYDRAGGVSNTVVQSFTVLAADVNVPTRPVFNKGPVDLDFSILPVYTNAETISFNGGKVYDADGVQDVDKIDFWLQKPTGEWVDLADVKEFSVDNKDRNRFNYSYDLKGLNGGRYQLWAVAYDKVGNVSNVATEKFAVITDLDGTGLSDDVRMAMARSANLESYDKEALAQTREWVVWVAPGESADDLAGRLGAINLGETGYIANSYVWAFAPDQTAEMVASQLARVPGVEFAYPLVPLQPELLAVPNDPLFANQWSLQQSLNPITNNSVSAAWDITLPGNPSQTVRGRGVVIGIVDDGLQGNHPDLIANYRADLSRDFNKVLGSNGLIYSYIDRPLFEAETTDDGRILWNRINADYDFNNNPDPAYKVTLSTQSQKEIPDNRPTLPSPLYVPLTGVADDINVLLDITHPSVNNLVAYLNNPTEPIFNPLIGKISAGPRPIKKVTGGEDETVELFTNVGGRGSNFTNTILDDSANLLITDPSAPFTGRYKPEGTLAQFNNQWVNGIWNLTVNDVIRRNSGFLNSWGLELSTYNPHGTAVAGIAAGRGNNNIGGTGVAPEASLAGLRLLATSIDDKQIENALFYKNQDIDIYNNSWKIKDELIALPLSLEAMALGSSQGRGGLGNIYVWAAGNDGWAGGNVNYNSFANSRYAIAVGAIDSIGKQVTYSESGASVLVSAYSSSNGKGITTTDIVGENGYTPVNNMTDYTDSFGGTSAAAPMVSGVIALMLEANPNLTWRDIQQILVDTAQKNDFGEIDLETGISTTTGWWKNGAGRWVNDKYGFGAIDAPAAVNAAINWVPVAKEIPISTDFLQNFNDTIPDGDLETGLSSTITINDDLTIEKVGIAFDADHPDWRDLKVVLTSPDGTESVLAQSIPTKAGDEANSLKLESDADYWHFTSVRHWGESSKGEWKLQVFDTNGNTIQGKWNGWKLNFYGTQPTVTVSADANAFEGGTAGTFTFTRDGNTKYDLAVDYSLGGTAVNGVDYGEITGNVIIPAGQKSVTVSINAVDDALFEKDETVILNLTANDAYNLGNSTSATVLIAENDIPAEPFTDINAGLTGRVSFAKWGDYDNDGDLDILADSKVYRNDNGSFIDISAPLVNVFFGSGDWGDYDNDGDLDILIAGSANAKIYRNDNGNFTDINAGLTGVSNSSSVWGDYDNDGDLDILLTGEERVSNSVNEVSKIYRNDGGSFVEMPAGLPGVQMGSASWGDYDNDGDLDILLTGGYNRISQIYRNDTGSFTNIEADLMVIYQGSANWGDYDNDGDLDILLTGVTDFIRGTGSSKIYRNDGGIFTDINASLPDLQWSANAWGDYDNDGDLDIILTGGDWSVPTGLASKVYRNDGGIFTDINATLVNGAFPPAVAWGDYDKDGDLDVFFSGKDGTVDVAKIYKNNTVKNNSIPTAPTNLSSIVNGNSVSFDWNPSSDAETPANGLTYNLRVGTTPGGSEILSPMASNDGTRKVAQLGNANENTNWKLDYLPPGTYYWSVQAVDNNFAGSPFSTEGSFTITEPLKPSISIGIGKPITPGPGTFSYSDPSIVPELDGSVGQVIIARRGDLTNPLVVNYTVSGTATSGVDYQPLSGSITIPADAATATIPVNIINDDLPEDEETVVLTLTPNNDYILESTNNAFLKIDSGAIPGLIGGGYAK